LKEYIPSQPDVVNQLKINSKKKIFVESKKNENEKEDIVKKGKVGKELEKQKEDRNKKVENKGKVKEEIFKEKQESNSTNYTENEKDKHEQATTPKKTSVVSNLVIDIPSPIMINPTVPNPNAQTEAYPIHPTPFRSFVYSDEYYKC
jgi:hypothetical protein